MGENTTSTTTTAAALTSSITSDEKHKKKTTVPPDDYKCNICFESGHWIQQCPKKEEHNRNRKKRHRQKHATSHVPVEGVDPSKEDIERARELQKIPPPLCYCGMKGRLKKVKHSNTYEGITKQGSSNSTRDNMKKSQQQEDVSPAVGKYFYFCSKKKTDVTKCMFAKPLDTYDPTTEAYNVSSSSSSKNKKPKRICRYYQEETGCKKGDTCSFAHELLSTSANNQTVKNA